MKRVILLPPLLAAAFSSGQAAARDYGEVGGWQLAATGESCGMFSKKAGNGEILIFKRPDGLLYLQVSNEYWQTGDGAAVRYNIDGTEWTGAIDVAPVNDEGRAGYIAAFAPEFDGMLRGGDQLAVKDADKTLGVYSLTGSARALNSIESCLADVRSNGPAAAIASPAAANAVPFPAGQPPKPKGGPGNWFNMSDYPSRAQKEGREGTVSFALTVNPQGRVSNCRITGSSGHTDIDESTCQAVSKRASFDPAKDANGNATEGSYSSRVTWKVPN